MIQYSVQNIKKIKSEYNDFGNFWTRKLSLKVMNCDETIEITLYADNKKDLSIHNEKSRPRGTK